jgi:hypothetical protein
MKRLRFTKQEKNMLLAAIILVTSFIAYFTLNFVKNCIFEWPIRWDVKTCWNEQKDPSWNKALETTSNFI